MRAERSAEPPEL